MQEQQKEGSWQALLAYDFMLNMFARHALLLVMFTKIDRKNPRVQSLRETFFLFCGYKNVRSHENTQHGNLHQPSRRTSPSSKRNQASSSKQAATRQ